MSEWIIVRMILKPIFLSSVEQQCLVAVQRENSKSKDLDLHVKIKRLKMDSTQMLFIFETKRRIKMMVHQNHNNRNMFDLPFFILYLVHFFLKSTPINIEKYPKIGCLQVDV